MQRETAEITTPIGKRKVLIHTYFTGREQREIQRVFLSGSNVKVNPESKQFSGFQASAIEQSTDKAIEFAVVSVDGHKQGDEVDGKPFSLIDTILDMHSDDYDFVMVEINKKREGSPDFLVGSRTSNTPTK